MIPPFTAERIRRLLSYDPLTGIFRWRADRSGRAKAGTVAGNLRATVGYIFISIDGKRYRAHRMAWLYMTGEWPPGLLDHKNRVRHDNSWANLRLATASQNVINSTVRNDSLTGIKGVGWHEKTQKYQCRIYFEGGCRALGYYHTLEEAECVYIQESRRLHGEFSPV